ncbi:RNA-directed DNA polymerase, eukaryota, reverse transcriptase zinc-binding domain protein [Tanacetum coccineum]
MRSKRDQKVPQNLEDYVHSINTTKTKNKKSVTKKNDSNNEKLNGKAILLNIEENDSVRKDFGETSGNDMGNGREEVFVGDLNGNQFPPIIEVEKEKSIIKGNKKCLDKTVVKQSGNGDKTWNTKSGGLSLADLIKGSKLDNKLMHVPTEVNDNGEGIVIFDDEIIELGSQKWNLTVCGQFIGCSMGFNEARYHIRRMWHKFGLKDVIAKNGVFYFKFQDEEGINEVINNGPWMVNNKPLVVQKWCVDMCMDKAEPKKIPVWIKMRNVPMEAWSVKGISALASSIGKPMIMDEVTTKMCVTGIGRIGFARVLVEIDVEKGIKDKIEVMYKSKNICEGIKKIVNVEYSWIPKNEFKTVHNRGFVRNGFNMNRNFNKQNGDNNRKWIDRRNVNGNKNWQRQNAFEYRKRQENVANVRGSDGNDTINESSGGKREEKEKKDTGEENNNVNDKKKQDESSSEGNNRDGILGSNRFTLLDSLINEEDLVPNTEQRKIVDEFLSKGSNGNDGERKDWTEEMKRYYRDRKEMFDATKDLELNEDVLEVDNDENHNVMRNEVEGPGGNSAMVSKRIERNGRKNREERTYRIVWKIDRVKGRKRIERNGLCSLSDKQKEVKKLILEEGLQLCAILETHVKYKNIKVCNHVYGNWEYVTNGEDNNKGCRIMENGNVFERVENLRLQVKECQAEVDKFPHDEKIKEKSWSVLKEYQQATKEEYSLLCQKAKVEWLKDGDRNTAYFHKTIKERMNRGRIMTIRNEEGVRFENKDVATQIVKHFEDF